VRYLQFQEKLLPELSERDDCYYGDYPTLKLKKASNDGRLLTHPTFSPGNFVIDQEVPASSKYFCCFTVLNGTGMHVALGAFRKFRNGDFAGFSSRGPYPRRKKRGELNEE
jgi:hypothetical protein